MQLHPTGTDPTASALLVCRNARWHLLLLLAIFWAIPVFWWYVQAPTWVLVMSGAIPLIITWPMLSTWRKRGRKDNWVLAVAASGVWLNLRDCEDHAADAGETVVYVPYREIAGVRRLVHRYTTPSSDNRSTHHRDVHLEILLDRVSNADLQAALAQERQRPLPEGSYFGGAVTVRNRRRHFPIATEGDQVIRIKFSSSTYGLRPRIKAVIALLGRYIEVLGEVTLESPNWDDVEGEELDDLVKRLAASGQQFDAIRILRNRRGLSHADARQAVEAIAAQYTSARVESATGA